METVRDMLKSPRFWMRMVGVVVTTMLTYGVAAIVMLTFMSAIVTALEYMPPDAGANWAFMLALMLMGGCVGTIMVCALFGETMGCWIDKAIDRLSPARQ